MFCQIVILMPRALLLLLFLTASNGVMLEEICVKSGELVALECPVVPEVRDSTVLFLDKTLVLLNASKTQQGNYSCDRKTYELKVDCENMPLYSRSCYNEVSCTLNCPKVDIPKPSTNITIKGVTWKKDGKIIGSLFSSVKESDQGLYSCARSFVFDGHVYSRTFTVKLDVKEKEKITNEGIISPRPNEVFQVDVGSPLEINCTALLSSDVDDVYWIMKETKVKANSSFRVYSSESSVNVKDGIRTTASLIFKEVFDKDLSTVFSCKLESSSQASITVNVTLARRATPSYVAVTTVAVVVPVLLVILVLTSIKYKIHITLFLRDTLRGHYRVSDGKSFDAYVMCYTSEEEAGLSDEDRKKLQSMLEDHFGYSLYLFDRDVLPGTAVPDAVLECVEQCRAVLMVPASSGVSSESALLSAVHEALVERQTRLVFIQNKSTENTGVQTVPSETLQLLRDLGHCITWKGSFDQSSFFWKQLRYYLPPVQQHHRITLLPQTV